MAQCLAHNGLIGGRNRPAQASLGSAAVFAIVLLVGWVAFQWWAGAQSGGESSVVTWRQDYDQALTEAQQTGRPVLLEFTADWCPPCQWMDAHVYSQPRVADRIARQFVAVQVDMTDPGRAQQRIANQWQVRSIPTLILLNPEGEPISRRVGRVSTDALLTWFDQAPMPAAQTQPAS